MTSEYPFSQPSIQSETNNFKIENHKKPKRNRKPFA